MSDTPKDTPESSKEDELKLSPEAQAQLDKLLEDNQKAYEAVLVETRAAIKAALDLIKETDKE